MIAPKTCACGEAMQWRAANMEVLGAYLCHHCDEACAGVASTAHCDLCARIKITR